MTFKQIWDENVKNNNFPKNNIIELKTPITIKDGKGDTITIIGVKKLDDKFVGVKALPKYYGRANQGVVTINLVDVACSSKKNMDKFWKILDERCELCHRALRIRHEHLLGTPSDVAPILWQYGALARLKKGETIDKLLYNGYSTISLGYAGLWETVYYMTGKKLTEPEGKEFGLKVMEKLNEYTSRWKDGWKEQHITLAKLDDDEFNLEE